MRYALDVARGAHHGPRNHRHREPARPRHPHRRRVHRAGEGRLAHHDLQREGHRERAPPHGHDPPVGPGQRARGRALRRARQEEALSDVFRIVPADPRLPAERARVLALLAATVPDAEVFEVGSTAVAGVIGKGDLDVLVRVPEPGFPHLLARLDAVLPRNPAQYASPIYQGYTVPSPLDVALQCTVTGGPHDDFLPFLDALRADPALVDRYNALKRRFDGGSMDAYREAKRAFVEAVLSG
ncbi:MAG: GrpB family protein [Alphaproteobacteria bacterium]|nr:GrpB family protein [Alphaproteobacteria bacterium]